ncbi:hypothetical protein CEXT_509601 [Caerostris extrusa]|uniref:Uncharacterized protein n=1 Tax=Caerostris extrusa TaxID=172846 RepID=A0AAV4PUT8_CAEEX|nr:hypothetical protein CEXT_509601 [Caerostris extrusa]
MPQNHDATSDKCSKLQKCVPILAFDCLKFFRSLVFQCFTSFSGTMILNAYLSWHMSQIEIGFFALPTGKRNVRVSLRNRGFDINKDALLR